MTQKPGFKVGCWLPAGVVVVVVAEKMRRIAHRASRGAISNSCPDCLKIPGTTRQGCVVVVVIVFVVELVDVVVLVVVLVVVGEAAAAGGANIKAKLGVRSRSVANPQPIARSIKGLVG